MMSPGMPVTRLVTKLAGSVGLRATIKSPISMLRPNLYRLSTTALSLTTASVGSMLSPVVSLTSTRCDEITCNAATVRTVYDRILPAEYIWFIGDKIYLNNFLMAYEQRKQLEQLMGKDALVRLPRDHDVRRVQPTDPSMLDSPRVCKSFLVGKCPYDLFQGTKEDLGPCPKIHQEKLKILYETCVKNGVKMPNNNYRLDYMRDLERVVGECNRKIRAAEKRLELSAEEKEKLSSVTQQLDELDEKVGLMLQEIALLVEKGELELALEWNKELATVVKNRDGIANQYTEMVENINQSAQQKLQVCEQCGAYLSRLDTDRRLADHFVGKMHLAYVEMRRALDELKGG